MNITYQDVTQGLEMEKSGTSHPQPKTTIFSQVLATPVDEQKAIEDPPHPASPLAEDEAIWCTSPPQGLSRVKGTCWLLPHSVDRMNLGPGGDNV